MKRLNWSLDLDDKTIVDKINELVDAVNELQQKVVVSKMEKVETPAENVPDLDIQLFWVGHLCRFWDYDKIESTYAILDDINVWCEHPYRKSNGNQYKHCEPVKPDDDIIYKGGNND